MVLLYKKPPTIVNNVAHEGELQKWGTSFKPAEIAEIDAIIKQRGMNRADFIRWAVAKLKEQ